MKEEDTKHPAKITFRNPYEKNVGEIETFFRDFLKKFNDLWILKKFWDFQKKV